MASLAPEVAGENAPQFPFERTPLHPAEAFRETQKDPWLTPIRMWNGQKAWLVSKLEDVRTLLSDKRFSADPANPNYPTISAGRAAIAQKSDPNLIRYDGVDHARIRKMFLPLFTVKRVEEMRGMIETITHQLIDDMLAGPQPVDFMAEFGLKLPSYVLCNILGVPKQDHEIFHDCSARLVDITVGPEENLKANEDFKGYVSALIEAKKADLSGTDIVTQLIRDHFLQGTISEKELIANVQILFLAGHETTANTLAHSIIVMLTQNPEAWEELRTNTDPAFVRNAVEELLRFTSVVQYQCARTAMEDIEFKGRVIRKGEGIYAMINGANRDENAFEDPNKIDFNRHSKSPHVTFGFGPHQCLGQALARLELAIALPALAQRMPNMKIAVPLEEIEFRSEALTYGVNNVMITW